MPAEWPLVGRIEELELLEAALAGGQWRGAVVTGAAGVGKTRLARELLARAHFTGWHRWWAAATRATQTVPFGALAAILPPGEEMHPATVLRRAGAMLAAQAAGRPAVLAVDDAHRLDACSAALVHVLASSGTAFVVLTVRRGEAVPDPLTALWKDELAVRIELQALSAHEVGELLAAALGGQVDGGTVHNLWSATRGNVLYLHELVQEGRERGVLSDASGVWSWRGPLMGGSRLSELIEARLAGLAPEDRELLEVVATAEPAGPALLAWAGGDRRLEHLERRGLIAALAEGRRTVVTVAHPLYGETVRAAMGRLRQQAVHRGLAAALSRTGVRRRCDRLRLATYEMGAGAAVDTTTLVAAADEARSLADHRLAERLSRRATEQGAGVDAALALGDALYWLGRFDEADAVLAGLDLARASDGQRATGAIVRSSILFFGLQRAADAEAALEAAAGALPDGPWRDEVIAHRASVALFAGRAGDALRDAEEVLGRGASPDRAKANALVAAVTAWALAGQVDLSVAASGAGIEAADALADAEPHLTVSLRQAQALAFWLAGRWGELEILAARQYEDAVTHLDEDFRGVWALLRGRGALTRGDVVAARHHLREAAASLRRHDITGLLPWAFAAEAQAHAQSGDVGAARAVLAECDGLGRRAVRVHEPEVGLARAWTAAAGGEHSAARRLAVEAADAAAAGGMRSVEVLALHDAVRLGAAADVLRRLAGVAGSVEGAAAAAYRDHAAALVAGDGRALDRAAERFAALGSDLLAAEASAEAAAAHGRAGAPGSRLESVRRWHRYAAVCPGARTPALELATRPADLDWLTAREREVAALAAQGLTKREIADRLFVSVRTVGNHLTHVYGKLGLTRRDELATLFDLESAR